MGCNSDTHTHTQIDRKKNNNYKHKSPSHRHSIAVKTQQQQQQQNNSPPILMKRQNIQNKMQNFVLLSYFGVNQIFRTIKIAFGGVKHISIR